MKSKVPYPISRLSAHGKSFLFFLLLTFFFLRSAGQINAYASVTGISGATLSLSNLNQTYHTFNAGDQIIIMQMQDNAYAGHVLRKGQQRHIFLRLAGLILQARDSRKCE
jgi:hypothetical protein